MSREVVLVTGASSGIGWELARLFAADGAELILVARRQEKLQELAQKLNSEHGTPSLILPYDLSHPDSPRQLFEAVQSQGKQVDVLINNAGFGQLGRFQEIDLQRQLDMLQVNIVSLVDLTHRFVQGMKERGSGAVLNLGSTAAFQPGPNCAIYYATKAFVLSFSEAISRELLGTGVSVTCLCPGPTVTGFGEESNMEATPLFRFHTMTAEAVAQAGHRGVRKKKRLVIPGFLNKLLVWSVRIGPRDTVLRIVSRLNRSRESG